jgi:hypothetical protein
MSFFLKHFCNICVENIQGKANFERHCAGKKHRLNEYSLAIISKKQRLDNRSDDFDHDVAHQVLDPTFDVDVRGDHEDNKSAVEEGGVRAGYNGLANQVTNFQDEGICDVFVLFAARRLRHRHLCILNEICTSVLQRLLSIARVEPTAYICEIPEHVATNHHATDPQVIIAADEQGLQYTAFETACQMTEGVLFF